MHSPGNDRLRIRNRFRRYECKYLVPEWLAGEITRFISPFVEVDPHAAGSEDNSYDIASLYLDTPDLRLFWESQEGILKRIKLRIRFYDMDDTAPVFIEIKRRHDRLVLKDRARLDTGAVQWLLAGGSPGTEHLVEEEKACFDEFTGWIARWLARPVVWVKYRREAYVGAIKEDVRITMDRQLRCAPIDGRSDDLSACYWRPVEDRRVVLEMKFDESCPDWMVRVVQRFDLMKGSYSKYGKSVKAGLETCAMSPVTAWAMPGI